MTIDMDVIEITKRLLLAIVLSGLVGFDRESKNRPAGIRTHIIVAVGACIITLIQEKMTLDTIAYISEHTALGGAININQGRMTSQVISGIGFLGAGTIIVTKTSVKGLTTAASIWTVACLGIAAGEGYYAITLIGFFTVLLVLTLLEKIIKVPHLKTLQIDYVGNKELKHTLINEIERQNVEVRNIDYQITTQDNRKINRLLLELEFTRNVKFMDIIDDLAEKGDILNVSIENT